jgi:hypothetical protein
VIGHHTDSFHKNESEKGNINKIKELRRERMKLSSDIAIHSNNRRKSTPLSPSNIKTKNSSILPLLD